MGRTRATQMLFCVALILIGTFAQAQTAPTDAGEFIEAAAATVAGFNGPVITVGLAIVALGAIWAGIKVARRALSKA